MPSFHKLSLAEISVATSRPPSARAQLAQAYDALLADFVSGEYGRAELNEGERRDLVRSGAHVAAPLYDSVKRDPASPRPPRPPQRRPTAAERYHEVLPRRMREGQPLGRRDESKRRHGGISWWSGNWIAWGVHSPILSQRSKT